MARINLRPSPWETAGDLAGGVAQGIYMGGTLAAQQSQQKLAEQYAQQSKLHNALQMLAQGLKSDDPAIQQWTAQAAQKIAPELAGMPPMPTGGYQQTVQRAVDKVNALVAMNPSLADQRDTLIAQELGYKDIKMPWKPTPEMVLAAQGAGISLTDLMKLPPDKAQKVMEGIAQQRGRIAGETERGRDVVRIELGGAAPGAPRAGGGRGGRGRECKWYRPDGTFIGFAPIHSPPEPGAVPDKSTERESPMGPGDVKTILELVQMTKDPTLMQDPAVAGIVKNALQQFQAPQLMNAPTPPPGVTPSPIMKPGSRKKGAAPKQEKVDYTYNPQTGQLEPTK